MDLWTLLFWDFKNIFNAQFCDSFVNLKYFRFSFPGAD